MPTFSTPSTHTKKNSCRMLEGEKNNMQAHTRRKKNSLRIKVLKKKFMTRPNHPSPPSPSEVEWSAPNYPDSAISHLSRICYSLCALFDTHPYLFRFLITQNREISGEPTITSRPSSTQKFFRHKQAGGGVLHSCNALGGRSTTFNMKNLYWKESALPF